ncbi:MAG: hypothetical protein WA364_19375 [Candidatus Nitrosopolaris sp.]
MIFCTDLQLSIGLEETLINQFGRLIPHDFVNQVLFGVTGKETLDSQIAKYRKAL